MAPVEFLKDLLDKIEYHLWAHIIVGLYIVSENKAKICPTCNFILSDLSWTVLSIFEDLTGIGLEVTLSR